MSRVTLGETYYIVEIWNYAHQTEVAMDSRIQMTQGLEPLSLGFFDCPPTCGNVAGGSTSSRSQGENFQVIHQIGPIVSAKIIKYPCWTWIIANECSSSQQHSDYVSKASILRTSRVSVPHNWNKFVPHLINKVSESFHRIIFQKKRVYDIGNGRREERTRIQTQIDNGLDCRIPTAIHCIAQLG
jgi:hypothetical protein